MRVDDIVSHDLLLKPLLSIDYVIRAVFYTDDPSERLNLGVTVYKFSSFLYFYTDFYGQVF
jgi:hypothetical protein